MLLCHVWNRLRVAGRHALKRQLARKPPEWSAKAVRDAFFASPKFPRLLNADAVKQTIYRGVEAGMMAYVVKETSGASTTRGQPLWP